MPTQDAGQMRTGFKRQNAVFVGIVLLFAGTAVALIQYKVATIMTPIMALFSMDASAASWLMSVFTLMSIIFAIPTGRLAQKFGAKKMMIVALGIAVVGTLIGLASRISGVLIFSRAIEGVALTVLTTCGPILVQRCVDENKIGTTMGIWGIWGCIGSTIAALVTPTLFEAAGFSGVWIVYAVVAAIAAVVVAIAIRVPPERTATDQGAKVNPPRYREIFSKDMFLFFGGLVAFNICLLAVLGLLPTVLQLKGFSPTLSGLVSTIPMVVSIASSPLFGALADKTGKFRPLLLLSMLVMGPCTFLMYTSTDVAMWAAVVVMGIAGMGGIGLFLGGFMKLLPRPELASIGAGVLICVQGVGQFLGTFLVQALLGPDFMNWTFAGAIIMVIGLVGTVLLAFCKIR